MIESNQERYYKVAFSYVKNREDALDIVHDAIVKALQSFHTLRNPAYAKTWFYRILINESLSFLRQIPGPLSSRYPSCSKYSEMILPAPSPPETQTAKFLRQNRRVIPLEELQAQQVPPAGDLTDAHKNEYSPVPAPPRHPLGDRALDHLVQIAGDLSSR